MPWTGPSGTEYLLVLLDTNALSEISKNPNSEGKAFHGWLETGRIAPCFTVYNLVELFRGGSVFDSFLNRFADVPCVLTVPHDALLSAEYAAYASGASVDPFLNTFVPDGHQPDRSYDLRRLLDFVFGDPTNRRAAEEWDRTAGEVLSQWLDNRKNFTPTRDRANAKDADRYVEQAGSEALMRNFTAWYGEMLGSGVVPDLKKFPSLMVMAYSQYWRLWDHSWRPAPGEVTDVRIMAVAPYVDIVVTERRQAEIFRKIQQKVPGLADLTIRRLSDLRRMAKA